MPRTRAGSEIAIRRQRVRAETRAAVDADRVDVEQRVDRRVGRDPHFLEAVDQVRRELSEPEVEEILGSERRIEAEARVLEFHGDRAVGVLAKRHLAEVRHVLAERARAEDVDLLRKLQVVLDAAHGAVVVDR